MVSPLPEGTYILTAPISLEKGGDGQTTHRELSTVPQIGQHSPCLAVFVTPHSVIVTLNILLSENSVIKLTSNGSLDNVKKQRDG